MKAFSHILITRFNVPQTFDIPSEQQKEHLGLNPGWLERRFKLFSDLCLPSVAAQTVQDFHWLVFFDPRTPDTYRARIATWQAEHPFFHPVYTLVFGDEAIFDAIRALPVPDEAPRITSRLDNDDMIHPRFLEFTRCAALPRLAEAPFFVTFPIGASVRDGDYFIQRYRYNPFTSLVAPASFGKTVISCDHRYTASVAPVHCVWKMPLWCQVIHGENIANDVRGVYWGGGARSPFATYFPAARHSWPRRLAMAGSTALHYLRHHGG